MLVIAYKRGIIDKVPEVEWLKSSKPEFDFFTFEEAERLLAAADGEWRTAILVALRTGMRHGEILALRWEDVDLVAGRINVRQKRGLGKHRHAQVTHGSRDRARSRSARCRSCTCP